MIIENISFPNNTGKNLPGRIYSPESPTDSGLIFSHGLFSSKDGYKIINLAGDIADAGHAVLAFDFSFSGESGGKLEELSVLQEVEDLRAAVKYFKGRGIKKIHLMGSSMGAAVTLLFASSAEESLKSLVIIAAPFDLLELLDGNPDISDIDSLDPNGKTCLEGVWLKNTFFKELKQIDMKNTVRSIPCPVLVIHGAKDAVVDPGDAEQIYELLQVTKKKMIIEDGDHNLTRDKDLDTLRACINSWLREME